MMWPDDGAKYLGIAVEAFDQAMTGNVTPAGRMELYARAQAAAAIGQLVGQIPRAQLGAL